MEPNGTLREVLKRNILQMRDRLDQMLTELDTVQKPVEGENIQPILTEKRDRGNYSRRGGRRKRDFTSSRISITNRGAGDNKKCFCRIYIGRAYQNQ